MWKEIIDRSQHIVSLHLALRSVTPELLHNYLELVRLFKGVMIC